MESGFRSGGVLDVLGEHARKSPATADIGADVRAILTAGVFPSSGPMTLLIDYDGTLVPYASTPDEAVPDADLLRLLDSLAAHRRIDLHLVSGRSIDDLTRWFADLNAQIWAEHGAAHRRVPGEPWELFASDRPGWMQAARSFLAEVTADTRGSLLEEKHTSLAWHYRLVDPDLADRQLAHVREGLHRVLADAPVDVLRGHMVLELRPRGVSKGLAVRYALRRDPPPRSIVAIGDDRTDEDMFAVLPPSGVAIRVGGGATGARYCVSDFRAVRRLLALALERPGPVSNTEDAR